MKLWQQGNNQALMLSAADQPLLHVLDSWRGDSGSSYSCAADGSNRRQPSDRLTQVFLEREAEMSDLRHRVSSLSKELQVKSLEVTALRTEAKLSAKRRVDLQDALEIERSRVKDLTSRVGAWQVAFGRIKEKARYEENKTPTSGLSLAARSAESPSAASAAMLPGWCAIESSTGRKACLTRPASPLSFSFLPALPATAGQGAPGVWRDREPPCAAALRRSLVSCAGDRKRVRCRCLASSGRLGRRVERLRQRLPAQAHGGAARERPSRCRRRCLHGRTEEG